MKLRPFQEAAVQKMVHFLKTNPEHGCYNATEPGLGKSCETIESIKRIGLSKILIICPAIMRHTWATEIKKWMMEDDAQIEIIEKSAKTYILTDIVNYVNAKRAKSVWVITSYALATNKGVNAKLFFTDFDCLVCDESHALKTPRAQRTKAILGKLWPKIPYRICLSGTPATSSIADLYTTFHRLNPKAFPDWKYFTERYTHPRWDGYSVKYEGIKNEKELSKIMRDTFYLRDTKEEVAKDLPPKNWCPIVLPNSYCISHDETEYEKEQHKLYIEQLQGSFKTNRPAPPPPRAIATKRKEQALKMVPAVVEFTSTLLEQGLPVVVFAHHLEVISTLKEGLNGLVISGAIPNTEREKNIEAFKKGTNNCLIVSMQAGGIGITLTNSSNAVFAEWDYNPSTISQAAARVHRIGTVNSVNLYYFQIDSGFDAGIFETCIEKSETFAKIV